MTYVIYVKHAPNVVHDILSTFKGNSYANEDAEMDFFHKFEINVDLLFIETI